MKQASLTMSVGPPPEELKRQPNFSGSEEFFRLLCHQLLLSPGKPEPTASAVTAGTTESSAETPSSSRPAVAPIPPGSLILNDCPGSVWSTPSTTSQPALVPAQSSASDRIRPWLEKLLENHSPGETELQMPLEDLGRVTVRLSWRGNELSVRFTCQRQAAELIFHSLESLAYRLDKTGWRLKQVHISGAWQVEVNYQPHRRRR